MNIVFIDGSRHSRLFLRGQIIAIAFYQDLQDNTLAAGTKLKRHSVKKICEKYKQSEIHCSKTGSELMTILNDASLSVVDNF